MIINYIKKKKKKNFNIKIKKFTSLINAYATSAVLRSWPATAIAAKHAHKTSS